MRVGPFVVWAGLGSGFPPSPRPATDTIATIELLCESVYAEVMATVTELAPALCPNGHTLGPNRCLVGWEQCACTPHGGHRTHTCRTCWVTIRKPPCAGPRPQKDRWAG